MPRGSCCSLPMTKPSQPPRQIDLIWLWGLGYFAFYVPYSALTKALTKGWIPGLDGPINGFEILPATALGTVAGMLLFVGLSGWWRDARRVDIRGIQLPWIGVETLSAAAFTAAIIGTTTLNYTFAGISIVLILLLMRGGVLILSPIVDLMRRRRVAWYSWTGLTLSLVAVAVALADAGTYVLTWVAVVNLAAYLAGYLGRFQIMSGAAKVSDSTLNRRFFIEEHMAAAPILVAALGLMALIGHYESFLALRLGFTSFLRTEAAAWAFLIGLLYEGLFIYGSRIYLHRREFTYCVPVNRGSSLLAGVVAAYALSFAFGAPPPPNSALVGLAIIALALTVLAVAPALERRSIRRKGSADRLTARVFLFVCGGNTSRSPMAAAICSEELATRLGVPRELLEEIGIEVESAGITVSRPTGAPAGAPAGARRALAKLGITLPPHASRALTVEMVERADLIFCMTGGQHSTVLGRYPGAAEKLRLLDTTGDIRDPSKPGNGTFGDSAGIIQASVRNRLHELDLDPG